MQILLINPPDELDAILGIGKEFIQKYEPLGLLYIAAVVRESGYNVSVIDAYAENIGIEVLKKRILAIRPNVIGITTLTCQGSVVFSLGQWIKKNLPNTLLVLGNIHASVFANQYLKNHCCDLVIHGEGEYIFLKILKFYEKQCGLNDIAGISFINQNGELVRTIGNNYVEDLSKLPFPVRDILKQKLYNLTEISNQIYVGGNNRIAKSMITSRGCPYRCAFCAVHHNQPPRYNDALKVVDEMEMLEKKYKASYVFIMDSLFMSNSVRLLKICLEIKKRNLKIKWGCLGHVNYLKADLIYAMDSAGCYDLSLGIESGSQKLLDKVKKNIKLSQVRKSIEMLKKISKILVEGLFILGLPGETYQESLQTIRFAKSLPLDMAQFSIFTPYPGSPLFEELVRNGEIDTGIRDNGTVEAAVWKRYSAYICFTKIKPIWVTPALSAEQLRQLQKKALREFYFRPTQIVRHFKRITFRNCLKSLKIIKQGLF
ncbi:MAG: radical SAM protein [Planctomycetota bacterium]